MTKPKITFAQLRQLLLDLGFSERVKPKEYIFFLHEPTGAEIALPIYRANRLVMPHHLIAVRFMLDTKYLMEADDFDAFVASGGAKKSA
jgi:hypothetical protein